MTSSNASRNQLHVCILLLSIVCFWAVGARADILIMKDGRHFEGTVESEKDGQIQFQTVVAGIRARLTLAKSDIKSIEKKQVSEEAQQAVETDPALNEKKPAADAVSLYLEIPIKGAFKEQVFAQAIRSTLVYAKLHGVKHIVFSVDSAGGPADEAGAIFRTLRQFENDMTYHAIIANCSGEAVIVPFLCKTIHLQAGATVGGLSQKLDNLPARFALKEEEVVRVQIADELSELARQRGRRGEIIKALVDPSVELAAWQDDKNEIELGPKAPTGVPAERVIFADGPDQVLTLTYEQATRLGVPTIKGGPEALGPLLGMTTWREESSYGRDNMKKAIAARQRRENNAQARFEDSVSRNIHMRELTSKAIETNLKQAASWNPTDASYSKLSIYWNTVWWDPTQEWNTNLWTPESRRKWQTRSAACAHFLLQAREGITSMTKLDKEAITLGLPATFKEGELAAMLDDVNVKLKVLSSGRNRVGD